MADGAATRDGVPRLDVSGGVPGEGGHSVAGLEAETAEGEGTEGSAVSELDVGGDGDGGGVLDTSRNNLSFAVHLGCVIDDLGGGWNGM